jgi:murein DD-endopeptidase MepM/ murein hydrolase activator NlpD
MKFARFGLFVLFLVIILSLIVYLAQKVKHLPEEDELVLADSLDTLRTCQQKLLYGIAVDSFLVIENTIKRNQFLGEILSEYQVTEQQIHELSIKSKSIYDVRKLEARKKYTLLCTRDSLPKAEYFIYEPSTIDFVVYKLKDSIEVSFNQKKIDTVITAVAGTIESSLWVAMTDAGTDPLLIHSLSEVFAWQVDFYRILKGDRFKVIYEQLFVDEEEAGIGKILGAYFDHHEEDYYAVYFDQGSGISYFDEKGQSLQKQFLRSPLRYKRISSRYTRRRYHPVLKRYKSHLGTDYAAPTGTPIRTVGDGIVEEARYSQYNGRYVKIRHNSVYSTQYLHMSKFGSGIKKGVKVTQGQVIGYVGSTGLANGPHLCFRFWKNGHQVDALKVKLPPSEPVAEDMKAAYDVVKDQVLYELDNISTENKQDSLSFPAQQDSLIYQIMKDSVTAYNVY